ncbi:hypothetical protein [Bacillus alkalicellulosilyticus]|uniref:hypothetical protein n=1 Tax=Alkalihalobacterium alkalicellulosilyticum TaxID=1912214 RepID=UPI000996CC42|nr:hypothetical protein [Bacillus alkalicellulosilyticus]
MTIKKNHDKHNVCIHVPKVYDWVTRQVELPLISIDDENLNDIFDCVGPTDDLCAFLENFPGYTVECNLIPDTIYCDEIKQHNGRQQVEVTLPTGETITLEKVKVLVKGLVNVTIFDATGKPICCSDDIQWATAQTFFLCAPDGTKVDCHITYFQCDADVICTEDLQQLDISILLCVDVQMETKVKLEVEAAICQPRQELPIEDVVCPPVKFPPQCPELFPGN